MTSARYDFSISVPHEHIASTRRTHRAVARTLAGWMHGLTTVILIVGLYMVWRDDSSIFLGSLFICALFIACGILFPLQIRRLERKAERYISADGETLFSVSDRALTIGDAVIPYERITMICAKVEGERYFSGLRGEAMAYRLDLTDDRLNPGRAIGSRVGSAQRRKMYREGAKSDIRLYVGVDQKRTLRVPDGMMNNLTAYPKRGDDPGRIDVPFGAYLGPQELVQLLHAVREATAGTAFPIALIDEGMSWNDAMFAACEPREKIWEEYARIESTRG